MPHSGHDLERCNLGNENKLFSIPASPELLPRKPLRQGLHLGFRASLLALGGSNRHLRDLSISRILQVHPAGGGARGVFLPAQRAPGRRIVANPKEVLRKLLEPLPPGFLILGRLVAIELFFLLLRGLGLRFVCWDQGSSFSRVHEVHGLRLLRTSDILCRFVPRNA